MINVGFVSELRFEPKANVSLATAGTAIYTTPDVLRAKLKSVANLLYKNATFGVMVRLPSAASAGQITVRLTDGVTDYATLPITLSTGQVITASIEVDLSSVAGSAALRVEIDVNTAATGPATATADAFLGLEMPTTILG